MKCTVLMPVYNAGKPLRIAIESILAQQEREFEFLIVDDASRDGSAEVIRKYAAHDSRIRAVFHKENRGLAGTLNEGLASARAELVARMDQDDESLPERLSTQIPFMEARPDVVVAGSFVYHMSRHPQYDRLVTLPVTHQEIMQTLEKQNCIYHPSVMLRRSRILELGGYRTEFKNAEDLELWLRTGRVYQLANIPIPLLRYRFSTSGMTLSRKWQQLFWVQMAMISHNNPALSRKELEESAAEALKNLDRPWFLQQVALGTVEELTRLRLWRDALRVFVLFSRELGWRRNAQVARRFATSAWAVLRQGRGVQPSES